MKIEGRTFVISGGASGLGRAVAEDLRRHGAAVALLDRNEEDGRAVAAALGGDENARFFAVDVTDTDSIAAAVRDTIAWTAATRKPLGGVVPAAGVGLPGLLLDRRLQPLPLPKFDFVVSINLRGTVDLVRQVLPHLAAATEGADGADGERGVVVMVASSAAFEGQMGQVAYAASKGAVASMTLPMARDLSRHRIRVVTIAPSMFETSMTAGMSDKVKESLLKSMEFPARPGKPEEFAMLVRQAIENPMLNGVVIRLDGASRMPSRL
ncbi:short chain dehydrogenase reductase [Niveomyces insectorum RCEF 264]|uniref:Short chain dehydrogenase reductase n=1 Tax=Niveomyces insectorum RCEF 264 TaxID=1081102 RepID=A0A167VRJ0_9HYPO|nr:short chain dehydrogenase reductase [Niveomyces insectorum RCEF 264]